MVATVVMAAVVIIAVAVPILDVEELAELLPIVVLVVKPEVWEKRTYMVLVLMFRMMPM